ncbi:MAG: hypothetical protein H0V70_27670 [Ktedonobacteraceae bacterium]|nr:hypothetical protein [Ktedonobacteraceae bacterium]
MSREKYTVAGEVVSENGVQLPTIVFPHDVPILEIAVQVNRLEWQGYEALFENEQWNVYLQTSMGLKKKKKVAHLSDAWLFINGW